MLGAPDEVDHGGESIISITKDLGAINRAKGPTGFSAEFDETRTLYVIEVQHSMDVLNI
jgi:hypothetical protein